MENCRPIETLSDPEDYNYRICGIAILGNELYIAGNDNILLINDLTTAKFKYVLVYNYKCDEVVF